MLLKYYSVVILCLSFVNGEHGEHKCFSRFDYDEKMLMKQLRFEDKVQKFEDFINEIKVREEKEAEERAELFATELKKYKQDNAEEIERQKNVTSEMLEYMVNSKMEFEKILKKINGSMKDTVVAFTVTSPADADHVNSISNSVTFTTVITNEGNGFDTSTGKFTCPVGGLYYFSLHITKKKPPAVDKVGCFIFLNRTTTVRAYVDPQNGSDGADNGNYGVSSSVYLKLRVGDVVSVGHCYNQPSNRLESWTSFSGYLERQVEY